MPKETYECAICHGIFEKGWDDSEAVAEMIQKFGVIPESQRKIVCEECYQRACPEQNESCYKDWIEIQRAGNSNN